MNIWRKSWPSMRIEVSWTLGKRNLRVGTSSSTVRHALRGTSAICLVSEEEGNIGLCMACLLAFRADVFRELIDRVGSNNAQNEFYVTDLVELANAAGHKVGYAV